MDETELEAEKELPSEKPIEPAPKSGFFSSNTFKILLFFFTAIVLFVVIFALLYLQSNTKKSAQSSYKVINIAVVKTKPGVSSTASPSGELSPTPELSPKLVILNGTRAKGIAASAAAKLRSSLSVNVVRLSNAQNIYSESVIVDLSGKNGSEVAKITKILGAQKSALPSGELKPTNTDILIILGSDFK